MLTTRDEPADIGLLVCGCSVCCVDRENIKDGTDQWHVVGPDMLDYRYVPAEEIAVAVSTIVIEKLSLVQPPVVPG